MGARVDKDGNLLSFDLSPGAINWVTPPPGYHTNFDWRYGLQIVPFALWLWSDQMPNDDDKRQQTDDNGIK